MILGFSLYWTAGILDIQMVGPRSLNFAAQHGAARRGTAQRLVGP